MLAESIGTEELKQVQVADASFLNSKSTLGALYCLSNELKHSETTLLYLVP